MRKLIKRVVILTLALIAVALLHKQVQKEARLREGGGTGEPVKAESTESMSVLRMGDGVTLGRIERNHEQGGVKIVVPNENGTDSVYVFTDVDADSWYANAVNFVVSAGLMTGIGDETIFQPEFGMLRENFASILYRFAHGQKEEPRYRFEDVPEDSWFYDQVSWVTNRRLMTGLTNMRFGVGEYMSCEQAVMGIYSLAGWPKTDGSLAGYPYAAKVSEQGRNAVDWAWKNKLITEVECVWYPTQAISRAQVALLLTRYSRLPQ